MAEGVSFYCSLVKMSEFVIPVLMPKPNTQDVSRNKNKVSLWESMLWLLKEVLNLVKLNMLLLLELLRVKIIRSVIIF